MMFGKRPDLLIFNTNQSDIELTNLNTLEAKKFVDLSLSSIEVRSSKFESEIYSMERKKDKLEGKIVPRTSLGFTVKVEDLKIVYRWIKFHKKSQSYFQVFFDKIYGLNFLDILKLINSNNKEIKIESPVKSQLKTTIVIPVYLGNEIARVDEKPQITAEEKISRLGRHDFYVKPTGGKIKIDYEKFKKVLCL